MSMIVQWDAADAATAQRLRSADVDDLVDWLEAGGDRISFDVDKAWHAVHFTLAGSAWGTDGPLGVVVLGGDEFGEDVGYGPARWQSPDTVAAAAAALDAMSPDAFASKLDFASMAAHDIYPQIWGRDPADDGLVEFVVGGYRRIRARYAEAAAASQGFVVSLL